MDTAEESVLESNHGALESPGEDYYYICRSCGEPLTDLTWPMTLSEPCSGRIFWQLRQLAWQRVLKTGRTVRKDCCRGSGGRCRGPRMIF